MNKLFNFDKLVNHDLYHLRYGKGAVIVAIPIEDSDISRQKWEQSQDVQYNRSLKDRKPIKKKISALQSMKINSGKIDELREHNGQIKEKILAHKKELSSIAYRKRQYFTGLQIAQFYTHNISQQSETHTRFDKIISVEESGTHVEISLDFSDQSIHNHLYHKKIGVRDHDRTYEIEGQVTRLVPIENVTLEIVSRSSI